MDIASPPAGIYLSQTLLTAQGDIIARDAGGAVRLAVGSAYQKLRVNAAGTDPEWASSKERVFVAQATAVGAETYLECTGLDLDTDRHYEIKLLGYANNLQRFKMRLNNDSGANYEWSHHMHSSGGVNTHSYTNATTYALDGTQSNKDYCKTIQLYSSKTGRYMFTWEAVLNADDTATLRISGAGRYYGTTNITSIRIVDDNGAGGFAAGATLQVYKLPL